MSKGHGLSYPLWVSCSGRMVHAIPSSYPDPNSGPIGFVLRGGPSRSQSVMSSAHMHSMLARSCVREGSTIITLNGHEPVSYGAYDGTNPFA
jgi:hypothetical protein